MRSQTRFDHPGQPTMEDMGLRHIGNYHNLKKKKEKKRKKEAKERGGKMTLFLQFIPFLFLGTYFLVRYLVIVPKQECIQATANYIASFFREKMIPTDLHIY